MEMRNGAVLAVGAHPDDVEYGCLGTLMRMAQDVPVRVLVLSGKGSRREEETRQALSVAGLTDVVVLDGPDGWLVCDGHSVAAVERAIPTGCAAVLFSTRWDTHQDHRQVEALVMAATRRLPVSLLGYHAISSTVEFVPNLVVDIGPYAKRKFEALTCHRSQEHKEYMRSGWFTAWHSTRPGLNCGIACAELFHVYQMVWP